MRLSNVLPNFPFITGETMGNYYFWTCYIRVVSRVAELLKIYDLRKLGNIRKLSKLHRMIASALCLCQNEIFVNSSQKLLKNKNKIFPVVRYFTCFTIYELVSNILWLILVCKDIEPTYGRNRVGGFFPVLILIPLTMCIYVYLIHKSFDTFIYKTFRFSIL